MNYKKNSQLNLMDYKPNLKRVLKSFFLISLIIFHISSCNKDDDLTALPYECKYDIDTIDFTYGIDYANPDKYLIPGEQSDLSTKNLEQVRSAIGTPNADIDGVLKVCHWVNQKFNFENAGGNMAGVNTVDELFEIKTFYGCHSQALIISSILREFGIPTIMIETADVQWAYDYRSGNIEHFAGHVLSEVYINNQWILFDNNCTYVMEYDNTNPYISSMNLSEKGLFVFAKGIDIWDYRGTDMSFTYEQLINFSNNLNCYEDLFYTVNYKWNN